jgi:hypothetical protein
MYCDEFDRGGQHGGVIGLAEHRHNVWNDVKWRHKIRERADQRHLHFVRRLAIKGAVIGSEIAIIQRPNKFERHAALLRLFKKETENGGRKARRHRLSIASASLRSRSVTPPGVMRDKVTLTVFVDVKPAGMMIELLRAQPAS